MKLTSEDLVRMPWKNGGGMTTEIAKGGTKSQGLDWAWRVSLAEVAEDGPFSIFPDIDRAIAVIDGAGMDLHFSNGKVSALNLNKVVNFDGAAPLEGRLRQGPIRDFNVMTHRHHHQGSLQILTDPATVTETALSRSISIFHLLEGSGVVSTTSSEDLMATAGETIIASGISQAVFTVQAGARAALARIDEAVF